MVAMPLLTPAELELMAVLWRVPAATVQELCDALGDGRAYTTVATIAHILEQKGFARSEREGRRLRYAAAVRREDYERTSVSDLFRRVFGGDGALLVRRLVEAEGLREGEAAELRALLAAAEARGGRGGAS